MEQIEGASNFSAIPFIRVLKEGEIQSERRSCKSPLPWKIESPALITYLTGFDARRLPPPHLSKPSCHAPSSLPISLTLATSGIVSLDLRCYWILPISLPPVKFRILPTSPFCESRAPRPLESSTLKPSLFFLLLGTPSPKPFSWTPSDPVEKKGFRCCGGTSAADCLG
ncbi:hypothetical protein MRB53_016629 [Persea americana]|uniref:Uncharacterized protein n=1 Tax=Persea americana TaxID=3435 RepID=A0ACC2M2S2_PERAE|nr:hypothetical protein MRB53_016629 [Persea americana]